MTRARTFWTVAISTVGGFFLIGATQWAMQGLHMPTGNVGHLGTEQAGVEGSGINIGVRGDGTGSDGTGLLGRGFYGVDGAATTTSGIGVIGTGYWGVVGNGTFDGVYGSSGTTSGTGVEGVVTSTSAGAVAIYGSADSAAYAAWFDGRVNINGTLTKPAGAFKIDHPLFPADRYLSHSFVESPDMKNIYDGIATLEADGTAIVPLPEWFEVLNRDFRYQLTCVGENAPVYIAEEVSNNAFKIGGGHAGMKVSWLVTGIRRDPYAERYRIPVEEEKPFAERGRYLHPELYGQAESQFVMSERRARFIATKLGLAGPSVRRRAR